LRPVMKAGRSNPLIGMQPKGLFRDRNVLFKKKREEGKEIRVGTKGQVSQSASTAFS